MNFRLVERGSPLQNLPFYYEEIKVTSGTIQVSDVNESGKYTLTDSKGREAMIITLKVTEPLAWTDVAIIILFLLLMAISVGLCYYCKIKRMCKSIRMSSDRENLLSESENPVNSSVAQPPNLVYAPGHPASGMLHYAPPGYAIPLQQQYIGQPVVPINPCNKTTQNLNSAEYSKLTLLAIPLQWFILLLLSPEVDLPANSVGSLPAPGSGTDVLNSVFQFNMEHRKKLYLLISCSLASCYPPLSLL
ncbi:hypothetical protein NFI96_026211 [Prochilodus magdalenae]|nr:hypothetical protein NFI96_026211 [Prochilodus magdalenae]